MSLVGVAAFVLIIGLGNPPSDEHHQNAHGYQQKPGAVGQQPAPPPPASTKPIPDSNKAVAPHNSADPNQQQQDPWVWRFFRDIHVTDALLALFTGLLVVYGRKQAIRLRESVDEMTKATRATERAADAALVGANAAERSAAVAEKALSRLERPYLFPTIPTQEIWTEPMGQRDSDPLQVKAQPRVLFSFRNYGRTPAIVREIRAEVQVVKMVDAIIPRDKFWASYETIVGEGGQLGPLSCPLSDDAIRYIEHIRAPLTQKRLMLMGTVCYADIFSDLIHESEFAFWYDLRTNAFLEWPWDDGKHHKRT